MASASVETAAGPPAGALLLACLAEHGSAVHPYSGSPERLRAPTASRDLADLIHYLCILHGRYPGLIDHASARVIEPEARAWLTGATYAFAGERAYLARLAVAAGPVPSTPGAAGTDASILAQRHALETLASSERKGCALGAAMALVLDWAAIRHCLDVAAGRFGVDVPLYPAGMRFEGTPSYVATDDLKVAVNAAVALRRPLLVKGEPGTGKTILAHEIAETLGAPLIEWHVKSTTKAHQGLYEYDAVARLRDGQLGDPRVHDISNYIRRGKLWEAFTSPELPVLLIDEIDKADIEFPNDLLQELDRMEFHVYETKETIRAAERPIVVITSNNEKELPDAFLRRCFFHYIAFPDRETMQAIVDVHFPDIQKMLVAKALDIFYQVREVPGLKKKPSTSELIDWLKLLLHEDLPLDVLQSRDPSKAIPPLHGALLKNEQDVMLFERLAFMARRQGA